MTYWFLSGMRLRRFEDVVGTTARSFMFEGPGARLVVEHNAIDITGIPNPHEPQQISVLFGREFPPGLEAYESATSALKLAGEALRIGENGTLPRENAARIAAVCEDALRRLGEEPLP